MKRLPINVMNFSAGRDTKLYEAFEEYYNAYVNGKASIGNVSFAEADKDILDAYKKEIEVNSGMKMENFASPEIYCNFTLILSVKKPLSYSLQAPKPPLLVLMLTTLNTRLLLVLLNSSVYASK